MKEAIITLDRELEEQYKLSRYNLYIPVHGRMLVFNTNTANMVEFDSTILSKKYEKDLVRLGLIVHRQTDEIAQLKAEYDSRSDLCKTLNLIIAVTLDCQCRCFYCYENHPKIYMNEQTKTGLIKLVKSHATMGNDINIVWYGGEPLLDFSTIEELTTAFQEICHTNHVQYSAQMITNAYAFDIDIIDKIDKLEIKEIQITLDGLETEHNRRRPVIGDNHSFERIVENNRKIFFNNYYIMIMMAFFLTRIT